MAKKIDYPEYKLKSEAEMTLSASLNYLLKAYKMNVPTGYYGPEWRPSPRETEILLKLILDKKYCSYLERINSILKSD